MFWINKGHKENNWHLSIPRITWFLLTRFLPYEYIGKEGITVDFLVPISKIS